MQELKELKFREKLIVTNHSFGNRPKAIVIHETDNESPSAGASNHSLYFATPGVNTSCHYVVDDAQIIKLLAHDKAAWHCGKPLGDYNNHNTIGIEICVNGRYFPAWFTAAALTASLMDETGIKTILRHKDVSGKLCPRRMIQEPDLWEQFLRAVACERRRWKLTKGTRLDFRAADLDQAGHAKGIVTASVLNVRSGRGAMFPVIGTLKKGAPVDLLYRLQGWWSIDFGAGVGFVSERYIQHVRQL